MRLRAILAASAVAVVGVIAPAGNGPSVQAAPNAGTVRTWNANALAALGAAGQPPNLAVLHMAMVQGAVYDAVNSIDGGHEPYLAGLPTADPTASMDAAVATAAYRVLDGLGRGPVPALPAAVRATLLAQYNQTLETIPDTPAKALGVEAGDAAAAAMLTAREGDGRYEPFPLTVGTEPGEWRPTPPENAIDPNSWISEVHPFTLLSASQFGTPGPRELSSAAYAHEYDEVKSLGAANSVRSPEQEAIARFYNVNPVELLKRTFRTISQTEGLSLVEDARLFGMLNLTGADTIITCWTEKRSHAFWRPITAIREGDNDGNPRTVGDPEWTPLETAPPYSDHTSGYNCVAGSLMNAGKALFGLDHMDFSVVRAPTVPGVARQYHRFTDVVDDTIDARVYQGLHFRSADVQGARIGRQVAEWVDDHASDLSTDASPPPYRPRAVGRRAGEVLRGRALGGLVPCIDLARLGKAHRRLGRPLSKDRGADEAGVIAAVIPAGSDLEHDARRAGVEQRHTAGSWRPVTPRELVGAITAGGAEQLEQRSMALGEQVHREVRREQRHPIGEVGLRDPHRVPRWRNAALGVKADHASGELVVGGCRHHDERAVELRREPVEVLRIHQRSSRRWCRAVKSQRRVVGGDVPSPAREVWR